MNAPCRNCSRPEAAHDGQTACPGYIGRYYVDGHGAPSQTGPKYAKTRHAVSHTIQALYLLDQATLDDLAENIDAEYRRRLKLQEKLQHLHISLAGFHKD